ETIFLGLRLLEEGVEDESFRQRFSQTPGQAFAAAILECETLGLVEVQPDRLRLTPRGRLLANQVFVRFMP
ncbi:MAG: coproporphyrinogen III oxidase family protein, partial [Chloroflexi bacterium]|nr:coproporphyrinogen III oxidase family protein [Chloroflexota bacterium]